MSNEIDIIMIHYSSSHNHPPFNRYSLFVFCARVVILLHAIFDKHYLINSKPGVLHEGGGGSNRK